MPSLNPSLTKDDLINSRWHDVVNSSERKECLTYNRAFWKKAQDAKEAGNVTEQAVFEILETLTGAAIKPESTVHPPQPHPKNRLWVHEGSA